MRLFPLLFSLLILFLPQIASAQKSPSRFAPEVATQLLNVKQAVETAKELNTQGILDDIRYQAGIKFYLAKASSVAGQRIAYAELMSMEEAPPVQAKLTGLQRFAGLINAVNTLWFLGIVFGAGCFLYLSRNFILFLVEVLTEIPKGFWELLFYVASIGLIAYGRGQPEEVAPYFGLTGTLLFAGALIWSFKNHRRFGDVPSVYLWIVTVIWIVSSLLYGSSLLGAFAVEALFAALGFSVAVMPGVVVLGFEEENAVPRATVAASGLLMLFLVIHLEYLPASERLNVFKDASFWTGSFVTACGLLIMSSKWYANSGFKRFALSGLTIGFAVALIFLGSILGIGDLSKVGYWLIVLFITEKYWEIPADSMVGYATLGLFFSGAIFSASWYLNLHRDVLENYFKF